jgi:histidine phosphotransferase ChpT
MLSNIDLAELLTAKLCHDITGPIGAISNGVEFLKEGDPALAARAHALIESSSAESIARLLFFRQLYGICKTGETSLDDIISLSDGLFTSTKTQIAWENNLPDLYFDSKIAKLVLNLLLTSSTTLIYGGTILINLSKKGDKTVLVLTSTGNRIKIDAEMLDLLLSDNSPIPITTRNVQVYYTKQLVMQLKSAITIEHDANHLKITVLV